MTAYVSSRRASITMKLPPWRRRSHQHVDLGAPPLRLPPLVGAQPRRTHRLDTLAILRFHLDIPYLPARTGTWAASGPSPGGASPARDERGYPTAESLPRGRDPAMSSPVAAPRGRDRVPGRDRLDD